MSKIDLKVCRGANYNDNSNYSLRFDLQNNDTSAVSLSALRVVGYMWNQSPLFSNLTSGVLTNGVIKKFTSSTNQSVGQTGIVNLNNTQFTYRVNHNAIDSSKIAPVVTLNIPTNQSYISPVSVTNRTDFYFDIVLTELPPNNNYSVTWFIPNSTETYSGMTTAVPNPTITFTSATKSVRVDSKKADSKFIIGWNTDISIPAECSVLSANYFIAPTSGYFFQSSKPSNSWYSTPQISDITIDDSYFVLEQFIGSSWVAISEFNQYGTLDNSTGYGPTTSNQLSYYATSSVYIQSATSNPISANTATKNILKLGSIGNGQSRSLVKFDVSIPTSATSVRNAVLRLGVNAIKNGWTYTGTSGNVSVHRVIKNWNESQATWTAATSSTSWSAVGGDYTDSKTWVGNTNLNNTFTSANFNSQFYVDVNVTDMVEYWRTHPSENYGFLVKLNPSSQETSLSAVEYLMNSSRSTSAVPELLIAYNSPNPNGPIPSVSLLSPENNSNVVGSNCNFKISTSISAGAVTSVNMYYRSETLNEVLIGSASQISANYWEGVGTLSVSGTSVNVYAVAISDLGVVGISDTVNINFNNYSSPTIFPVGKFCYSDSFDISGTYSTQNVPSNISVNYTSAYIPSNVSVFSIIQDKNNSNVVWFSTYGNGLWRYDNSTGYVKNYNTSNSNIASDYILSIGMKQNGFIFISCRNELDVGIGVSRFNTVNWNLYTNDDWETFDKTNSILSNYSDIDIWSLNVDSNDNVWFGLSNSYTNNVIKMVGNDLIQPFTTVYSIGTDGVRSISVDNNNVVVGLKSSTVGIYSSATNTFKEVIGTYSNARSIAVDSSNNLWVSYIGALGHYNTTTSAWTYTTPVNTPAYPYGLASSGTHKTNAYGNFIVVSGSDKFIGFSNGDSNEYNGGIVKYSGSSFATSAIGSTNNWTVYDKDTTYSLLSNFVLGGKIIGNKLWIGTDRGISLFDGTTWQSPNKELISYTTQTVNGIWSSTINSLNYNYPTNLSITFDFPNYSNVLSASISAGHTPAFTRIYPTNSNISLVTDNTKLFEFNVSGVDFSHGETATYKLFRGNSESGPWIEIGSGQVTKNIEIIDTVYVGQKLWYYINVTTNTNCSANSDVLLAYNGNAPIIILSKQTSAYNSSTPAIISGTFYDVDVTQNISVGNYTAIDSVSAITLSSDKGYMGVAEIVSPQTMSQYGVWKYIWNNPTVSATKISATAYDSFGKYYTTSSSISAVKQSPVVTMKTPPTSGTFSYQYQNITLSATTSGVSAVTGLDFYVSASSVVKIGSATSATFGWSKTIPVSAITSAFNYSGGSYGIYASAVGVAGLTAISNQTILSANNIPSFELSSPNGPACHTGAFDFSGLVTHVDSSSACLVELFVSGTKITSGTTTNNKFAYTWSNPPSGVFDVVVITHDPANTLDYSTKTFSISAGRTPGLTVYNSYAHGEKNGSAVLPYINVVGTSAILSATVNSAEPYVLSFWNSNALGEKISLLSANTTSAISTFSTNFGNLTYVLVEVVTNAGCSSSQLLPFYVFAPSVVLDDFNNCSQNVRIKGTLDFDGISGTNPIIDNIFIAKIYANNVYIDDVVLAQAGTKYLFNYVWTTPVIGTSAFRFDCVNKYGTFSTTVSVPVILGTNQTNTIVPTSYSSNYSGIYIVSGTSVTLSSSINDVKSNQVIVETKDSVEVFYFNTQTFSLDLKKDTLYNIKSIISTNGGCEVISDYVTVIRTTYSQDLTNIISNGCSNNSIDVYGYVGKLKNVTGGYDSSATSDVLKYETINSKVYEQPSNTLVYTVSADSLNSSTDIDSLGFNFTYYPTVGTSSLSISSNSSLFGSYQTIKQISTITSAQSVTLTASSYSMVTGNSVTVGLSNTTFLQSYEIYMNGTRMSKNVAVNWIPSIPGSYTFYADTINNNGCKIRTSDIIVVVNSVPVGLIVSPTNNSYIMSGTTYDISILTSPSYYGTINAVNVYTTSGAFINSATNVGNVWTVTGVSNVSGFYANIYDTAGISAKTNNSYVNIISATTSFLSASSATYNAYDTVTLYSSGTSPNTSISTIEIYEVVGSTKVYISATDNYLTIPASIFGQGIHKLVSKVIDNFGAYSYSSEVTITVNAASKTSFPTITYVSSNPETKIAEYGSTITSILTVSDSSYGILSGTIGVENGTIKSIASLNGINKYQVEVEVSGTCNLTLSAKNRIGNTKSETIYNYIFSCEGSREINLTNFIPNHLTFDGSGNDSEFYTLTKFYEHYLNTIYTNLDKPCSLGVLEKTSRLRNLHDPDTMELDYIQFFANYLGYNVDVNKAELGGFTIAQNSSAYSDGPDNSEVFSEYQKKALRFVVRNLPNWYSIKTTRNSIKMLLLSFGIFGDLLEVYTNDYTNDWVINSIPPGTYVSDDMNKDRYPTPHMYVEINLNNTNLDYVYGSDQTLTSVYKSFDAIRPANVVFEGILGNVDTALQPIYTVNAACMMEKDYIIKYN